MNPSIVAALMAAIPSLILMGLILHDEGKHARKKKDKRKGKGKGKKSKGNHSKAIKQIPDN